MTENKPGSAKKKLISVSRAAAMKGVARQAVYAAVKEGRLPHAIELDRIALLEADVEAWEPVRYGQRPGTKGHGGRPKGVPVSEESKAKMSESAKRRWQRAKHSKDEEHPGNK
jgi:predicted DNA-binding transcriptional regulator AlpA